MAEDQDERSTDDLSDEPSPHKIEENRKKGKVAQSKEISGVLSLMTAGMALYFLMPRFGVEAFGFFRQSLDVNLASRMDLGSFDTIKGIMMAGITTAATIALPIGIVAFVFGAFGSFAQIGAIFSTDPLSLDLKKIDPIKGAKKFLTMKQLYDGIRLVVRMGALVTVSYSLVKTRIFSTPELLLMETPGMLSAYGETARIIFTSLMAVLVLFAGFDFWLQKWEYGKSVRVTKKEAKEEHKDKEGDPQVKARIRTVQREMVRKRMMEAVKTADVVVTNPTHIAIAIKYDKDNMAAPRVVAKGADFLAQKIKKIAAESDVPQVENVPLARALFKAVKVGHFVPRALYQAVAEVLAYIYRLKNREFD